MTVPNRRVFVIGISGATCSGKTTVAKELHKVLSGSKIFCQDDYYYPVDDPRHVWIPELNHINWDIVESLDMARMTEDIQKHINDESRIKILKPPPLNGQIVCCHKEKEENILKINETNCHIVIIEGFCIFNYKPLADLCDLKYYFTLNYDECFKRRVKRVYEPPDCPGYFDKCAWPEHLKQLAEVQKDIENVVYFDGTSVNHCEHILRDIVRFLK